MLFFFKQKTAYEMRISDWSSDVCSSDLMNRPVEYRAHVNLFHTLFFSLTPDDEFIEQQLRRAMYLIDESGALQYNNLKEKGYFNSILSSSAVLTLQTDSIVVDTVRKYFRYYGQQDRKSTRLNSINKC